MGHRSRLFRTGRFATYCLLSSVCWFFAIGCGVTAPLRWTSRGVGVVVRVGYAMTQQALSLLGPPVRRVALEGGRTLLAYALDEGAEVVVRAMPLMVQQEARRAGYRGTIELIMTSAGLVESVRMVPVDGQEQQMKGVG